ncbi:M24 family metallopeptidase [Granulicella paludicola]|uniref:M24 family metallopeptidase n=1 Tax=Granulicella paludicola TaxID=474951 RepID=UPI0021E03A1F|nr:Xaa-Pro peptidase family protein [Granulicella paludicola]
MLTRRRLLFTATAAAPAFALGSSAASAQRAAAEESDGKPLPPSILALKNRSHEAVPITSTERQQRLDRARELMQQQKIAALTITGGTSLQYFLGIGSGQSERMFAWTLPASGAPFIVCPSFEEGRMTEALHTVPGGATTKIYTWHEDEDPYALLASSLKAATTSSLPLALDERLQFVFADRIAKAVAPRATTSGIPIVSGCRSLKTPAELALMQLANNITLSVYKAVYQACGPGMTNRQFTSLVDAGYARCGVRGEASCQVAEFSAQPHGSPTPQIIREGEMVLIDDGCFVEGYQSDMSRSFVYGKPTDRQKKVFDVVHAAQAAALAAAHPGAEMQSVDAAARKVITDAGFGPDYKHFTHRVGHGIGMDMHEWYYLVRGNTMKLAPGMTFSDEPGIYLADDPAPFGVRLEDDMLITADGAKLFTPQSPSLTDPFGNA